MAVVVVGIVAAYGFGEILELRVTNPVLRWGLIVVIAAGMVTLAELLLTAVFSLNRSRRTRTVEARQDEPDSVPARAPITPQALQHQIAIRLTALSALPPEDLAALPEWSTEIVPFGDTRAELITYSILREDGSRSIVVQAVPEGTGFVWRNVHAAGFRLLPDGEKVPIGEPEIFEFK